MTFKYLIRKVAFHYSDDYYYFHTMGVIVGDIYDDYQEAYNALMNLERQTYLSADLADFEPFFRSGDVKYNLISLKHYLDNELGLKILEADNVGRISAPRETFLPKDITDEQLEKIRSLSGLKFHELVKFANEPIFYGIWKKKPFYKQEGFKEFYGSVYFYNSYIEAYKQAVEDLYWSDIDVTISGTLEEITDMPVVFQSAINGSYSVIYDEVNNILKIYNTPSDNEWATLCTLLKEKPFEIKILKLEDVKNADQASFEYM